MLGSSAHGCFIGQGGSPSLTSEVSSGHFENVGYDCVLVIRTDDKSVKVSDLCIFNVFESIVGCCSEVPKVLLQLD